jgi:transposase-like protein
LMANPAREPSLRCSLHHGFITTHLTSRLVGLIKRTTDRKSITVAASLVWEFRMNHVVAPSDECPHCRLPLEIVSVKLSLRGPAMVYACTNCAMTRTENPKHQAPRRVLGALFRMIGGWLGQHSSGDAFHELPIGVGARESAHDAHDRLEGPTRTVGIVTQAEDA